MTFNPGALLDIYSLVVIQPVLLVSMPVRFRQTLAYRYWLFIAMPGLIVITLLWFLLHAPHRPIDAAAISTALAYCSYVYTVQYPVGLRLRIQNRTGTARLAHGLFAVFIAAALALFGYSYTRTLRPVGRSIFSGC